MKAQAIRVELTPTTTGGRVKMECRGDGKMFREAGELSGTGNLGAQAAAWVNKTLVDLGFEVGEQPALTRPQKPQPPKIFSGLRD